METLGAEVRVGGDGVKCVCEGVGVNIGLDNRSGKLTHTRPTHQVGARGYPVSLRRAGA